MTATESNPVTSPLAGLPAIVSRKQLATLLQVSE